MKILLFAVLWLLGHFVSVKCSNLHLVCHKPDVGCSTLLVGGGKLDVGWRI